MKIRTDSELFEKLDSEISWRRIDIIRLRKIILTKKEEDEFTYKTLLRSAIPLIYAHWEGFIKESALALFNFIALRKLEYKRLNPGFLSLFVQTEFLKDTSLNDFEKASAIIDFCKFRLEDRSNMTAIPEPFKTKSNLNSLVLKEICFILDLNYEEFRGFEVFIDSKLITSRNRLAHGEYREIDWDSYNEIHTIVVQLISNFKDQIENFVVLKKYLRQDVM